MTDLRKAAEMALEYLEYLDELDIAGLDHQVQTNALRQALAQPEQEPVAIIDDDGFAWGYGITGGRLPSGTKVYTAPQKPDVTLTNEGKTWQGLTEDDKELLVILYAPPIHQDFNDDDDFDDLFMATENKLKEYNT